MPDRPVDPRLAALRPMYRDVFNTPLGQQVLKDLRRWCRADKSTYVPDDPTGRKSAALEGKRSVLLYVEAMRAESDDLLDAFLEP